MAEIYSPHWGNNHSPQIRLVYNIGTQTGNTVRIDWILDYVPTSAGGAAWTNGIPRSWEINIDGQKRSGSFNINGVRGATRISNGSITVSKTNSGRGIGLSASIYMDVTWAGSYKGWVSTSGSMNISARDSHTVSYNANGGSGAPGNQTKWYGDILTLSSTRPSRSGYNFTGWKRSDNGQVIQPGEKYGDDKNLTLTAQWQAGAYSVYYNANGGTGAPGTQTKMQDQPLTLSSTKPSKNNYRFGGWGVSSGSTTASYQPGGRYTANASITLYAIWISDYDAPNIYNVSVDRCNSSGTLSENGTYAKVSFYYACSRSVKNMKISSRVTNSGGYTDNATFTDSRTSGTITKVVGGSFKEDTTYDIQITVSDTSGSASVIQALAPISFVIDFKYGGKGVSIGGPANKAGFEVYFSSNFKKEVNFEKDFKYKNKSLLDMFYPVGSIFLSANSTNPESYMGGKWTRFGNGRALVGVDETDSSFNVSSKTGGAKTHTLSKSEMPRHSHETRDVNGRKGYFWAWSAGGHPSPTLWIPGGNVSGGAMPRGGNPLMSKQSWEGYTTTDVGDSRAHNNLQPYITVYMWRRYG